MRRILFVAGAVVVIVGAGLFIPLLRPAPPATDTDVTNVSDSLIRPSSDWTVTMAEATTPSGTLVLDWTASNSTNVTLYAAGPCPIGSGVCPSGSPIVSWNSGLNGRWTGSGPINSTYVIAVSNRGSADVSFFATLTATYNVPAPSQVVPTWALILAGSLILLSMGGIAVFLGLFLPGGVYASNRSGRQPPPGTADEPEEEPSPEPDERDEL